ncbi:MAG: serine hydrolase [Ferruginibacter sp.]|nr:serine hydrolase [Ferruginibacter sp.]
MCFKNPCPAFLLLIITVCFLSCSSPKKSVGSATSIPAIITAEVPADSTRTDAFLENLLRQYPQYFDSILQHRKDWNVQLIYTQVDKGANGMAALKNYYFNLNAAKYFYPASTVKLPVSILALQKLNQLKIKGVDKNTTMITGQEYSGQTPVYNDPTTPDGRPSIAQYIKKILMVSDNDAFNRLYEFLGQEYINDQLHRKGYGDVQLLHRLNIFLSPDENRHTNPVQFFGAQNNSLYSQPMQINTVSYLPRKDSLGKGLIRGGQLITEPMDFSLKNRISLEDLHTILVSLVFPYRVHSEQRFDLTPEDRNFLLKYMSQLPTESTFPPYSADTAAYWPAYCKFLLYGSEKGVQQKNIRIFNKVGDAYGQLTDVAYIVDFDKKIEFFLSATIYCNKDGILNDDEYDYNTIGLPFMKNLGEVIYDYEVKRKRKFLPDLSPLIFKYDK